MDRESVFAILRKIQPDLKNQGVRSLAVFGSVARNDYSTDSDLDILIEFDRPIGLFDFIRVKLSLEHATNFRVDLVTRDALRPEIKERVLGELIYVP